MTDETTPSLGAQLPFDPSIQPHQGILDQSLAQVLRDNPRAQQMIMQSMGIPQEKFQEMLFAAQQNDMMHMKIRDLFASGIVKNAVMQQSVSQEDTQQVESNQTQKFSFLDKIKSWFR